jgi:RNA polymerase nonessential primary-like sigma factor
MPRKKSSDAVYSYLKSIGRVPLLTHEQEISLGKQVKAMMPYLILRDDMREELDHDPSLAEWAARAEISQKALETIVMLGKRAKHKMIEANLRLVVSVAKKYADRDLDLLDLIQEGSIGLNRAVEKFDPAKGYRFSTYAYWWIRQAMTRAIAEKSRVVRLPIHVTETLNKIKKAQRQLSQCLGRSASIEEVAEQLELTPKRVRDCLRYSRRSLSLDIRVGDEQNTELVDLLESDDETPEDFANQESLKSDLQDLISTLTPQQQKVLSLRFGLQNGHPWSLEKVGQHLDLSRESVRQLQKQAMKKLRQHRSELREYLAAVS